jgi:predicted dienelactone hydrolase
MKRLMCGLALATAMVCALHVRAQAFQAGITRITVEDDEPFEAFVAYPTIVPETLVAAGPMLLSAASEAPVAGGSRFPIVLFSHGSGRGAGTPLPHRKLLLHLAREGFVVVAPFHPSTRRPFVDRPRQIRKALASVQADPRFVARVDPARVGMVGFSFGGAVTLLSAGAMLDLDHLSRYCREHRDDDPRACDGIPTDGSFAAIPPRKLADAVPLKSVVLLEPFGAPFAAMGLRAINMPALIYHARHTDLRPDGNALALALALPRPPQLVAVPGSHFVFVDPCPAALEAQAPQVCRDPSGIDRAAILKRVRQEIADFLRGTL